MTRRLDNSAKNPLGFLQPRDSERAAKARGPRRVLMLLRWVLPLTAALVVVGLITWPYVNPNEILVKAVQNIPDLVIENLNYNGTDSNNQPYSVSAFRAMRSPERAHLFDLEKPKGEITLDTGAWIAARAHKGRFDQEQQTLALNGQVELFHDQGYQFTSDEAHINLRDRTAEGDKPVLIQGSFGQIRGQGFRVLNSGKSLFIQGPASANLNLHASAPSDKKKARH